MRNGFTGVAVLAGLALLGALAAGCQETQKKDGYRWGADGVTYIARPGDTPTSLSERAYGNRWHQYLITNANRGKLKGDGTFKPGAKLTIPPGIDGRPVDLVKLEVEH